MDFWKFPKKVYICVENKFLYYVCEDSDGDIKICHNEELNAAALEAITNGYVNFKKWNMGPTIHAPMYWNGTTSVAIDICPNSNDNFESLVAKAYRYIQILNKTLIPVFCTNKYGRKMMGVVIPPKDKMAPHFRLFEIENPREKNFNGKIYIDIVVKEKSFGEKIVEGTLYIEGKSRCIEKRPGNTSFYELTKAINNICREFMEFIVVSAAYSLLKDDEHMAITIDKRKRKIYGASISGMRYICDTDDTILSKNFVRQPWSIVSKDSNHNSFTTNYPVNNSKHFSSISFPLKDSAFENLMSAIEKGEELSEDLPATFKPYTQFFGLNKNTDTLITEMGKYLLLNSVIIL